MKKIINTSVERFIKKKVYFILMLLELCSNKHIETRNRYFLI